MLGQDYLSLAIGGPVILGDDEIAETAAAFGSYGLQDDQEPAANAGSATARA